METITQTNRTILFAEINPERLNLLTLVGDVRGKSSLDDDKIKEINEELLVSSFEEFLEKLLRWYIPGATQPQEPFSTV
jgi:hypothetical protein